MEDEGQVHEFLTDEGLFNAIETYRRQLAEHERQAVVSQENANACRGAIQALEHLRETAYPSLNREIVLELPEPALTVVEGADNGRCEDNADPV